MTLAFAMAVSLTLMACAFAGLTIHLTGNLDKELMFGEMFSTIANEVTKVTKEADKKINAALLHPRSENQKQKSPGQKSPRVN